MEEYKTRIAIFTVTGSMNYGQRLQNYALQEVLKSFADDTHDVEVETVVNRLESSRIPFSYYEQAEEVLAHSYFASWCPAGYPAEEYTPWLGREIARQKAFHRWDQTYVQSSAITITRETMQSAAEALRASYDWGVVGSDQIWNPGPFISSYDFAACMPHDRRLSYAASFGVRTIPEDKRSWYQKHLKSLAQVSVREEAGAAIVKELTGYEATVVPDPSMLLPKEIWRLVMKRPEAIELPTSYLLVYDLRMADSAFSAHVRALADELGLGLVVLPGADVPFYNIDPSEFIYLIAHATAVLTDSFHGTCFSLMFGKPFLVMIGNSAMAESMSSRFETLLQAYNVEERCVPRIEDITAERLLRDDLQDVPRRIRERRAVGATFLEHAMPGVGSGRLRLNSVALMRRDRCTGCTACAMACQHEAITMHPDDAGFLHPVVNHESCADCGLCLRVCPVCTPMLPKASMVREAVGKPYDDADVSGLSAYAVQATDDEIRAVCSSGGVFPLLAMQTIAHGGVVIGAALGNAASGWRVHHEAAEDADGLARLMRSKYVQSDKEDIFHQTASYLGARREVLFSGTGCEVQGLLRYLASVHQDTTHLLTADVVCHGVPSPELWRKYMQTLLMMDGQEAQDVQSVRFRDKGEGWHRSTRLRIDYRNGARHLSRKDWFLMLFLGNFCLRDSCYQCPARSVVVHDPAAPETAGWQAWRSSDLTIGDFWGIEHTDLRRLDDDKGVSLVFTHSPKGRRCMQQLAQAGVADVRDVRLPERFLRAANPCIFEDVKCPEERTAVLQAVKEKTDAELLAALKKAVPQL